VTLGGLLVMMIVAGLVFLALRGTRALGAGQQPQQLSAGPVSLRRDPDRGRGPRFPGQRHHTIRRRAPRTGHGCGGA